MDFEAFEDILNADVAAFTPIRVDRMESYPDTELQKRYHLRKETVLHLLSQVESSIKRDTNRKSPISPKMQVLLALRILTGCTLQLACADLHSISQASASRILRRVVEAICRLRREFIRMPTNVPAVKQAFYQYGGFPGVLVCVDGTHIPISKPKRLGETEIYRCRKGYFSINAQILCGPEYMIYDVVARWPGSTHDSRIFDKSALRQKLEEPNTLGVVLSVQKPVLFRYMLTPLRAPTTDAERRYNRAHIRTRNTVERTIGILKRRFGCLGTKLRYEPQMVGNIIVASCILHNLAILHGEPVTFEPDPQAAEPVEYIGNAGTATPFRQTLIASYFAQQQ